MKHAEECKYIWEKLVPENGSADNLQGELLRQIEKLRYEAINNGNINWDDNFDYFCDFIKSILCESDALSSDEKSNVADALARMKAAGCAAVKFNNGEIPDKDIGSEYFDVMAYAMEEDLYDFVCDAIAVYYLNNKQPILYNVPPDIYR